MDKFYYNKELGALLNKCPYLPDIYELDNIKYCNDVRVGSMHCTWDCVHSVDYDNVERWVECKEYSKELRKKKLNTLLNG